MSRHHYWATAFSVLAMATAGGSTGMLTGCASDKSTAASEAPRAGDNSGANAGNGSFGQGTAGTGGGLGQSAADAGVAALPPEKETTVDLQLPQASENYVYAANPVAGTVSVIDAKTLSIRTLDTGAKPTYLRTLKGTDNAIALNIGSDKASVIRSNASASVVSDLDVVPGANAIGITPDGVHAVVYLNSTYASAGNSSGSSQDVTVLTLSADGKTDKQTPMTVGYGPRDVFFSADSKRAFVVTEDGVSVLDFADIAKNGSGIAHLIQYGGGVDQKTLDVAVTPDGKYALARAEGKSLLQLIDLASGTFKMLDIAKAYVAPPVVLDEDGGVPPAPLPVVITDLDLDPNGKSAIAVLRNQSAMVTIPLPAAFDDATKATTRTVDGEVVGSVTVAPDGKTALLYTTATEAQRITIVDLVDTTAAPKVVALRKGVLAVTFTPDSKTALITNTKVEGSPSDPGLTQEQIVDRQFGYSLLRVATANVKLQTTRAQVGPITMVSDPKNPSGVSYLFILFRDDASQIKEVHRVSLGSFIVSPIIELESPPISLGSAPASGKVFVNQDHPDGRMTFINWMNPDEKNTVTGFELNSRIRD